MVFGFWDTNSCRAVPTDVWLEISPTCPAENTQIPIWREGFGFLFPNTVLVSLHLVFIKSASGFILFHGKQKQKEREASSCHSLSPGVSTAAPPHRALQCCCSFSSLKPHSAPSSKTKVCLRRKINDISALQSHSQCSAMSVPL